MPSTSQGPMVNYRTPKPRKDLPRQPIFQIRPGTSDAKAVLEVIAKNAYRRRDFQIIPGERWLDLGCNVGAFAVMANLLGAEAVRAVEAERTNAGIARRNLGLNGFAPNVLHAAVVPDSHVGETIPLNVNTDPLSLRRHSIQRARKRSAVVQVPAVRFSSLPVDGFDCIKLNVEGAEVPILQEDRDWSPVRKLVFEWSFDVEPRMAVLRAVLDRLEAAFPNVKLSKGNLPWHLDTFPFFPPNVYVFCWRP